MSELISSGTIARIITAATLLLPVHVGLAQQQETAPNLEQRIADLEQRVTQLERLLSAKSIQSVEQAAARLLAAEEQLRFTERLYAKGYASLARLKADELAVARARADLDSAKFGSIASRSKLEIRVLEAEASVAIAEDRLRYTEQMARRGYAAQAEVLNRRSIVDSELRKLQQAKSELSQHRAQPKDDEN